MKKSITVITLALFTAGIMGQTVSFNNGGGCMKGLIGGLLSCIHSKGISCTMKEQRGQQNKTYIYAATNQDKAGIAQCISQYNQGKSNCPMAPMIQMK